jgi:hypothetical protein
LKDLGVNGRIILKWFLKNWQCRLDLSGSRKGPVAVSCEYGNEPKSSIKY